MPAFRVTNNTPVRKQVRPAHGNLVSVRPKEAKTINMDTNTAKFHKKIALRQLATNPERGTLEIYSEDEEQQKLLDGVTAGAFEKKVGEQRPSYKTKLEPPPKESRALGGPAAPGQRTAQLLARADEISVAQLRSEARDILGDRYPQNGSPTKEVLVSLLNGEA